MGSCMSSNSAAESPASNKTHYTNNQKTANNNSNINGQSGVNTAGALNTNYNVNSSNATRNSQTSSESNNKNLEGQDNSQLQDALADNYIVNRNPSVSRNEHRSPVASTDSTSPGNGSKSRSSEVKILLLGSGESGKSTIIKQIKIIHQGGYSQDELMMYKMIIYQNLVDIAKSLVKAIKQFNLESQLVNLPEYAQSQNTNSTTKGIESGSVDDDVNIDSIEKNQELVERKKTSGSNPLEKLASASVSDDGQNTLHPELFELIKLLYREPVVCEKLFGEYRSKFYIMDSATYFFDNVDRIGSNNYIPTVNDVLRTRIKTTGIYETRFQMGGLNIHMYDVGGQRSERKKWIHCFENVTSIIFCVALSEYDQVLLEEKKQNRMAESLVLFDSVINSRWFTRTSVVLFLNKIDVFTEKIPRSPLENYFPDYSGGNDINKAAKYILWRFTNVNRGGLNIYPHLTQATDTSNIKLVLATVKETILQNALRDSGIL
ncbi:G-alpha-domain-containing protein [Nadsonia fulvescens var. elongata DSM 6958]|uniref:G-alpha-domain-containing protein n=1 Tax=Nadsonia fulvescens var. elongata DSM 6958 TaxID=857566 RepID=A0A1E3PJC6_9ASCO|nr:G-alpha-domain-containing protein [Nadsonia fulvescens var. elongata DSM 6958]